MPIEYEYRYNKFDKEFIIKKLKELGGIKKDNKFFRVQVFQNFNLRSRPYIRIRDEGKRVTMTVKLRNNTNFNDENEVEINDYDTGIKLLEGLGCVKKCYYEKMRETWHLNDVEICFDTNPGRLDIMEIEAKEEAKLLEIISLLGLEGVSHDNFSVNDMYQDCYGIILPKNIDLTFDNVHTVLGHQCTKNKRTFDNIVNSQKEMVKKFKKDVCE